MFNTSLNYIKFLFLFVCGRREGAEGKKTCPYGQACPAASAKVSCGLLKAPRGGRGEHARSAPERTQGEPVRTGEASEASRAEREGRSRRPRRGREAALFLLDISHRIPSVWTMNSIVRTATQALYNQRIKSYPNGKGGFRVAEVITFPDPTFNPGGWELATAPLRLSAKPSDVEGEDDGEANKCSLKALNRAKRRAFDLMACNPDCDLFVTLTLDSERISRTEWGEIVRKLNVWLDNAVRRRGLKYILVPEYHADGEAIHFHGLMNSAALKLVDSGKRHKGKAIYNIANWKYGFTTAKRIGTGDDEHIKCTKYIFKYMTKNARALKQDASADVKPGGRYFLHGGELAEPRLEFANVDFQAADGETVTVGDGRQIKIFSTV